MELKADVPLFYWTEGSTVIFEEFSRDRYFHNAWPIFKPMFCVAINASDAQPTPIPVNPPSGMQALLSDTRAKVSWRVPHLLNYQGKGAWQMWRYRLEVKDVYNNHTVHYNFSATHQYLDLQLPNTNYMFRVLAYTDAGAGPWSTEFSAKTLNSREERRFIWSTEEGLFEGDMLGDQVKCLATPQDLDKNATITHKALAITHLAWFEDTIYMVTNNQIRAYNRRTGNLSTVLDSKSDDSPAIKAIAIDWIGRRLYWSDPTRQTISRCRLEDCGQKEALNIVAMAKELAVDSLRGYIYYSADHAVEAYRPPNAKNKTNYYTREQYSGSTVVGLTLDMENERVYWIVRGSDNTATLYSAEMIKDWTTNITPEKILLQEMHLRGPIVLYSDRLLYLKDDSSSAIADLTGRNVARINSPKFSGIRTISVINPTQYRLPQNLSLNEVNVIPDSVAEASIRTTGSWSDFNVTWAPVTNVNYGTVFYQLLVRVEDQETIVRQVAENHFEFSKHTPLHPFTPLEVDVQAYTYWAWSRPAVQFTKINSPSGVPLPPTNLRVFIARSHDHYKETLNSTAYVRWSPPAKKNGNLSHYVLEYCSPVECKPLEIEPHVHQMVLDNITHAGNYTIKVAAATDAGVGDFSETLTIQPKAENPLPRLLVGTTDQILKVDLDMNSSIPVVKRLNTPATHLVHISKEKRIFWTNENELWACLLPNETKTRLAALSSEPLSLTVDWVERVLYWTTRENERSFIYMLNLNKFEEFKAGPEIFHSSNKHIIKLVASPLDRLLIWSEFKLGTDAVGEIITYDLNERVAKKFAEMTRLDCGKRFSHTLMLDSSHSQERGLIWNEKDSLIASGLKRKNKSGLNVQFDCSHSYHAKDSARLYWISNQTVEARDSTNHSSYSLPIPNAKTLTSFYRQSYPNWNCLVPIQQPKHRSYVPTLETQAAVNNLTLKMPQPEMHMQCPKRLPTIKYVIYYSEATPFRAEYPNCNARTCRVVVSLEDTVEITGLKPFTRYRFQVAIKSHYSEHTHINVALGPSIVFSTAPGAPSPPSNLTTEIKNPTEVKVQWSAPEVLNSDSIYYVVHYEFEDSSNLNHKQIKSLVPEILLEKLNPQITYKVWIRAHSTPTTFSESESANVTTFAKPDDLTAENITSTSITLKWQPQNIMRRFVIVYEKSGSPDKQIVFDSNQTSGEEESPKRTFFIGGLSPKTFYTFTVFIYYTAATKADTPFIWPAEPLFKFETLGGVPTAPGKPKFEKGFNIRWEPSKENGALIEEYSLEGYKINSRRIGRRSTEMNSSSTTMATLLGMNLVEERENITIDNSILDEQWTVYYSGPNTYWFAAELSDDLYRFRVRARNAFGYSTYSVVSDEINRGSVSSAELSTKTMLYFVVIIITTGLVVSICICISEWERRKAKFVCKTGSNSLSFFLRLQTIQEHQSTFHRIDYDGCGARQSAGHATRRPFQ